MCILFTVAYISLLFLRARFLFLYAGEFYSTVQNFWICLTVETPQQQADWDIEQNINKATCGLKLAAKLRR
jgi:hypothetical protein